MISTNRQAIIVILVVFIFLLNSFNWSTAVATAQYSESQPYPWYEHERQLNHHYSQWILCNKDLLYGVSLMIIERTRAHSSNGEAFYTIGAQGELLFGEEEIFALSDPAASELLSKVGRYFTLVYCSSMREYVEFRGFSQIEASDKSVYVDDCIIFSKTALHETWGKDLLCGNNSIGFLYLAVIPYE